MAYFKNVASQKVAVIAYDSTDGSRKTGDAANITAQISKDFGAAAATNDINPTELDATDHPGVYVFDLTQAETNAEVITITPASSTANVELDTVVVAPLPELASADDVVKKFGVTLTVAASPAPDTTGFSVDSASSLTNIQIDDALVMHLSTGRYSRITNITGTAITISPALPAAPTAGDEVVVFGKYLASL